jgi:hypothetical protein
MERHNENTVIDDFTNIPIIKLLNVLIFGHPPAKNMSGVLRHFEMKTQNNFRRINIPRQSRGL